MVLLHVYTPCKIFKIFQFIEKKVANSPLVDRNRQSRVNHGVIYYEPGPLHSESIIPKIEMTTIYTN